MTAKEKAKLKKIRALMLVCGVSRREAEHIVYEDAAIDRGPRLKWEISEEEDRALRARLKMQGTRKEYMKTERSKPEDIEKRDIISKIKDVLEANYEKVNVTNEGKFIEFAIGDNEYLLDLKKHRKYED